DGLQYLYNLEKYGMRFGLKRIKTLLKSLGNPQDKLSVIHIAGTNGKGSTSAMIASVLAKAGYKVGLYTSPHLARFNERIRISGKEITDKKIVELVARIRQRNGETERRRKREMTKQNPRFPDSPIPRFPIAPTFFEFTTAMAFLYFAEEKVDFAVIEVGLGGRLDATNVGRPIVSIITNISKDHEAMLGSRMEDITFEKAGIIKKSGILISAETKTAALKVLTKECKKKKAIFYRLNRDFFVENPPVSPFPKGGAKQPPPLIPPSPLCQRGVRGDLKKGGKGGFAFKGRRWLYRNLTLNLLGRHQYFNVACVLATLEILQGKGFCIPESAVRNGLKEVSWPGRLEIVSEKPIIILDCAHNPAGAEVLKDVLENEFDYKKLFLVLGIMADKDMKGILSRLAPLAHTVILTRPKTERAASLDALYKEIMELRITTPLPPLIRGNNRKLKIMLIEDIADACGTAISMSNSNDMICITGSVFTVGEARNFLLKGER
ncbi:MAG: bifunctional folylpolyglutamate synthase/dihydrofolate synthase, partial [Deltaproteobacteria bacterium]|nr:bifunctional folylpolyglutamate synthase/dihydrofolate synthase [Deltaproteobacteria bacterium]